MYQSISMPEFEELYRKNKDINILDVRELDEYADGHVPTAVSLPLSVLADGAASLSKNQKYYIICRSGNRSAQACTYLGTNGYDAVNIMGGMLDWRGETE